MVAREMARPCATLCRGRRGWHKVPRHKVPRHKVAGTRSLHKVAGTRFHAHPQRYQSECGLSCVLQHGVRFTVAQFRICAPPKQVVFFRESLATAGDPF